MLPRTRRRAAGDGEGGHMPAGAAAFAFARLPAPPAAAAAAGVDPLDSLIDSLDPPAASPDRPDHASWPDDLSGASDGSERSVSTAAPAAAALLPAAVAWLGAVPPSRTAEWAAAQQVGAAQQPVRQAPPQPPASPGAAAAAAARREVAAAAQLSRGGTPGCPAGVTEEGCRTAEAAVPRERGACGALARPAPAAPAAAAGGALPTALLRRQWEGSALAKESPLAAVAPPESLWRRPSAAQPPGAASAVAAAAAGPPPPPLPPPAAYQQRQAALLRKGAPPLPSREEAEWVPARRSAALPADGPPLWRDRHTAAAAPAAAAARGGAAPPLSADGELEHIIRQVWLPNWQSSRDGAAPVNSP